MCQIMSVVQCASLAPPDEVQMKKLEVCWFQCLRNMVRGGQRRQNRDEGEFQFVYSNTDLENIIKTVSLRNFINAQHLRYIGHQEILQGPLDQNHGNFWEFLWTKQRS